MKLLSILLLFSLNIICQNKIDERLNRAKDYTDIFDNKYYGGVNAKTTISFELNKKENSVHVIDNTSESYISLKDKISIPISFFYDNNSSIGPIYSQKNHSSKKNKVISSDLPYESNGIFHSDYRLKTHVMNILKKGESKTISFEQEYTDPKYFTKVQLMSPTSFLEKEVTFEIPHWAKIEIVEFNLEKFNVEKQVTLDEKKKLKRITYKINEIKAFPSDNSSEAISFFSPHLIVLVKEHSYKKYNKTYLNKTSDLYDWYRSLTKDLPTINDTVKDFTTSLINDPKFKSDLDKINQIYYWVQNKIRYIAFEDGIAGFKPDHANNVFKKKYGDCKGKANLLKGMLTYLGYDARLTWIGTNSLPYDYSIPSLCVDNHMICTVFLNNKIYYLDGTETHQSTDFESYRIRGKQVMIENKDTFLLKKVSNCIPSIDQVIEKKVFSIKNNTLNCMASITYSGDSRKEIIYGLNNSSNPSNYLEFFLAKRNNNISNIIILKEELNNPDTAINLSYIYEQANSVTKIENELYVNIQDNLFQMEYKSDSARISAIDFGRFIDDQKEYSLDLKDLDIVHLPKELIVNNKDFKLYYKWIIEDQLLILKFNLQIPSGKISAHETPNWSIAFKELQLRIEDKLILKQK